AGASVRDGSKQPRSEDVLARRQLCLFRCRLRTSRNVDVQGAAGLQLKRLEKTHVWTMPRQRTGNAYFCPRLQELRRDPDTAELRDAVRFADVLLSPPVLVDGVDMEIA